MTRTTTRAAAVLAGTLLALGTTGAASAAPTTTGRVVHGSSTSDTTTVDREVCAAEGFAVQVHEVEVLDYTAPLDARGVPRHFVVHVSYDATLSAHGITLHEADRWTELYRADGSWQMAGNTVHVTGPGGLVQHDAGRVLFNPDGSVARISGPHPQFLGQTWCSALVP